MAKISRLDIEGTQERERELKNLYYQNTEPYTDGHSNAKSDGDVKGKGTGVDLGNADLPGMNPNKTINYGNVITHDEDDYTGIGGSYDIYGKGASLSGRKALMEQGNLYNKHNEYGENSVDVNHAVNGQYYFGKYTL